MRRKDREVTDFNAIVGIIDECDIIRIGLADGDYPYIVPVNFAYTVENEQICFYIHGAMAGRKYEMLKANPRCSFEMDIPLEMDCMVAAKDVTMRYKSVMGKCEVEFIEDNAQKEEIIDSVIMARYEATRNFVYNKDSIQRTAIARLKVTEITAKVNPIRGNADV